MEIIDSHSHIYLQEFDADRTAMLDRAAAGGVSRIYMPAIDASTHAMMIAAEADQPVQCLAMMGLHPCSVKENFRDELAIARQFLEQRHFAAVGETGLDFYWDLRYKEQQYIAFREQVDWAMAYNIPVVIHSRNSIDECIELIAGMQKGNLKAVFHCFTGTIDQAKRIIDAGGYLGIGGVLTFRNSELSQVIAAIGLEHVLFETDAPYLAPVPFRGKRNEPAYLRYVVEKTAEACGMTSEEVCEVVAKNSRLVFGA